MLLPFNVLIVLIVVLPQVELVLGLFQMLVDFCEVRGKLGTLNIVNSSFELHLHFLNLLRLFLLLCLEIEIVNILGVK